MEASEPRRKKWLSRLLKASGLLLLAIFLFFLPPLPESYRDLHQQTSLRLTDRHGESLRSLLSERQGTDHWLAFQDMPPHFVAAVLRAEDKRFRSHWGLDPIAISRASFSNLKAGRIVSGASTVTQQLLRTLEPDSSRGFSNKIQEMYWALRIEWRYSKDQILEAYLNRVAFGPTIYGVEEASRYYFDKSASALSVSESALLAVLIRAPSSFDPFTEAGSLELKIWSDRLLAAMRDDRLISADSSRRAQEEKWTLSDSPPPFRAAHFCDALKPKIQGARGAFATSLDLGLQTQVEGMVKTHLRLLAEHDVDNAAVVILDVQSGEILSLVGSGNYDRRGDGQHNAALSHRQPGSTLKPFTYALLLESTGNPSFVLPDLDIYENPEQESFIPKNYDGHFHGPVSVKTALACSYNVPAVRALERVGVVQLLKLLQAQDFSGLDQTPDHYGLGLTLGDGSSSLLQLVGAYRTLARGGVWSPLSWQKGASQPNSDLRILTPQACFQITDILSNREARIPSFGTPNVLEFGFPVAVKTGTSKGYRDNWTVGYTPQHVVGVWVGNSDGSPMTDVSGITGAGPLFRDVMLMLGDGGDFERPVGLLRQTLCRWSGERAGKSCPRSSSEWILESRSVKACSTCRLDDSGRLAFHFDPIYREWALENELPVPDQAETKAEQFQFAFPQDGDVFRRDADLKSSYQRTKFKVIGGTAPFQWSLNGRVLEDGDSREYWWELQAGTHLIEVQDAAKRSTRIRFEVR